jgi:RNA polymerase sigma-70 factor (ECF subfamily)
MDKNTYIKILETHRDRIFSYALYCLRDQDDAEDLTQEVFLRLWRSGDDLPPDRAEPWLIRVAHNLVIDQARKNKTRRRALGTPDSRDLEGIPEAENAWHHPGNRLDRQGEREEILNAMSTLQEETRSVMLMHYFQGLRLQDIAEVLGKKTSTIKVQLHRARKALRLVLEAGADPALATKRETG